MKPKRIVVVGASAGGVEGLRELVAGIPRTFAGAVLVVLHLPADGVSQLPKILTDSGPLVATHPHDGEAIEAGRIYVAPPDYHLLTDGECIGVKKGPKENRFRPSIDALFRSAAYTYKARTVGVVLSGALDDGTSGLWAVKRLGGVAIVQRPEEAQVTAMPLNASNQVEVDYSKRVADIGPLLDDLINRPIESESVRDMDVYKQIGIEVRIAASANAFQQGIMEVGTLSPFTCPECHGILLQLKEGKLTKYRCHTGHGYSASALLAGVSEAVGEKLWEVTRALEECVMLLEHSGHRYTEAGHRKTAEVFFQKARETEQRAKRLQQTTLEHEHLSEDGLYHKAANRNKPT
jgi:two-component system, chemotaxis family, protein-glutamate methylesterase/glutaminase